MKYNYKRIFKEKGFYILLPLFFSVVGGYIAYYILKEKDKESAIFFKNVGWFMFVINIILFFLRG